MLQSGLYTFFYEVMYDYVADGSRFARLRVPGVPSGAGQAPSVQELAYPNPPGGYANGHPLTVSITKYVTITGNPAEDDVYADTGIKGASDDVAINRLYLYIAKIG